MPFGSEVVEIVREAASTVMVNALVAEIAGLPESVSWKVRFEVPGAVGVPLMTPVLAFKLRPAGSVPEAMLHVKGETPPLICRVTLYAVPTVALTSEVEVMAGSGVTVILTEADLVASLTDVAVRVTVRLAATLAGALKVAAPVVVLESVPPPATVQVTPLAPTSLLTVAVKAFV